VCLYKNSEELKAQNCNAKLLKKISNLQSQIVALSTKKEKND
jgi:hypothetical protein